MALPGSKQRNVLFITFEFEPPTRVKLVSSVAKLRPLVPVTHMSAQLSSLVSQYTSQQHVHGVGGH